MPRRNYYKTQNKVKIFPYKAINFRKKFSLVRIYRNLFKVII